MFEAASNNYALLAAHCIHLTRRLQHGRLAMRQGLGRLRAGWASVKPRRGHFGPVSRQTSGAHARLDAHERSMASLLATLRGTMFRTALSQVIRYDISNAHPTSASDAPGAVSNGIHHMSRQHRLGSHRSATHDRDVSPTLALAHRGGVARPARNTRFTRFAPRYLSLPASEIARGR